MVKITVEIFIKSRSFLRLTSTVIIADPHHKNGICKINTCHLRCVIITYVASREPRKELAN